FVAAALRAAARGERTAQELLAFARQRPRQPRLLDVGEVLRGMEEMLLRTLGDSVQLRMALAQNPGRIRVDPDQLERAILNLVVNARDAMPEGGTVTVETRN